MISIKPFIQNFIKKFPSLLEIFCDFRDFFRILGSIFFFLFFS